MDKKKLFLLDGTAMLYRAYFAFIRNPMINSKGVNTSALFGFVNILLEILNTYNPSHIAVALDVSGPTFRHEYYPEYKLNRDKTPEAIVDSMPYVEKILAGFQIPLFTRQRYEADDIIGSLAVQAGKKGFESYLVTPDKDFAQLVNENTFLIKPQRKNKSKHPMGIQDVLSKWKIERIDQVVDFLSLAGDSADNIPGIPGVGEKTAQKLLNQFGSLENLLENVDQLKGKRRQNVEQNRERVMLWKKLVTIKTDLKLDRGPEELAYKKPDATKLGEIFSELEFTSFMKRIFGSEGEVYSESAIKTGQGDLFQMENKTPLYKGIADYTHSYETVQGEEKIGQLAKKLAKRKQFCMQTLTSGRDPKRATLIGISFSFQKREACFVRLPVEAEAHRSALEQLRPILENEKIEKTGHDLKYDLSVLLWHGISVKGILFDTMTAAYLLNPDGKHKLATLVRQHLDYDLIPLPNPDAIKKPERQKLFELPVRELTRYAAEKSDIILQLRQKMEPLLAQQGQGQVFYEIEEPLISVLAKMEFEGIKIDRSKLAAFGERIADQIGVLKEKIYASAGEEFNLNSPKQLGEILFDRLKLVEKPKKTPSGQYATGESILKKLAHNHQIAADVLRHRSLSKLKSTYIDALPSYINSQTGRLHTTFAQTSTRTGRLASSDPNLQNIPVRTSEGREIRKAFVPRSEDYTLLSCDYSQIELRIMAELSGDTTLCQDFSDGRDIHSATAARIYNISEEEVTREFRRKAKMVNFGIIYGISAYGLGQRLEISRSEAAELIEQYFQRYSGVKRYLEETISFARERGYVETISGRRRHIRDINVKNKTVRSAAERNAINAPIQGTAADMIKIAMIRIAKLLEDDKFQSRMLLQIHDELIFDLHKEDQLIAKICKAMQNAIPMKVPVVVDCGTGANWLAAH